VDGSGPRQLTHDGIDAENPTATPDGRWVAYDSRNPKHPGLWIVGSDGAGARRVVEGRTTHPEVSPDGKYAIIFGDAPYPLRVVELPGGAPANFEIRDLTGTRARWMPDSRKIVFLHQDENGRSGLFIQDFVPGKNTAASRRKLAGFDPVRDTESFGISADGSQITLAQIEWGGAILQVDGVSGIEPAQARP
jgi:TolB protein